jgi:transcription elongation factor GreB
MPNYLTPEGAKKLGDELRQLATIDRPKVVLEVSDAAAQGDRSENAEYIYGKRRLREIDRRIRFITKRLDGAVDEDGNEKRYRIVGPDETDPTAGCISFQSPLGNSLMKRKVGDTVTVRRPAGEIEVEIRSIEYE